MGRTLARVVRIVFQIVTTFLLLGFIILAVGGIVIKLSTNTLQSAMATAMGDYKGNSDDVHLFASFILEIADTMAIYCIVIGIVLAVFCLIGLIASCRHWYKTLKIYAIILGVLLLVQIIVVAVVFSNPTKFANGIVSATEALLKSYGDAGDEGMKASAIWNVLMGTEPLCCGMDGYKDFEKLGKKLPPECCNITTDTCNASQAQTAGVTGCRSKVELISIFRSAVLLRISIAMIVMQALLTALVVALIFVTKGEETIEDRSEF